MGSAWKPFDEEKYKQAYLSGCSNDELASLFNSTLNKVLKYNRAAQTTGALPKRGSFQPGNELPDGLDVSDELDLKLLKHLKRSPLGLNILELSNHFDVAPHRIEDSVKRLGRQHYLVDIRDETVMFATPRESRKSVQYMDYINGDTFKFGVVADTHLGSVFEDLDAIETMYDFLADEGVTQVFHVGNYIDGESKFNKRDIHTAGCSAQVGYFVRNYPVRDGITTHFITGDCHEGWYQQREGINIGEYTEMVARKAGRDDLHYLGHVEHDIMPDGKPPTKIRLFHPGGGTSYATSYKPQKTVDSLSDWDKPHILLIGHYHKRGWFAPRGVETILAGCFQQQSTFMRKHHIGAHLGGYIITVRQADDGRVVGMRVDSRPFYDMPGKDRPSDYI